MSSKEKKDYMVKKVTAYITGYTSRNYCRIIWKIGLGKSTLSAVCRSCFLNDNTGAYEYSEYFKRALKRMTHDDEKFLTGIKW